MFSFLLLFVGLHLLRLDNPRLWHEGLNIVLEPLGGGQTQRLRLVVLNQSFDLVDGLSCLLNDDIIALLCNLVCLNLATEGSHVWLRWDII